MVGLTGVRCLGDRNNTGSLPQDWDSPQTEAGVKNVLKDPTEFISIVPKQSGANPVRTRSLPHLRGEAGEGGETPISWGGMP